VQKTVFALLQNGRPIGYRRPETGLLAGLWQLPETDGRLSDMQATRWLGERNLRPIGELRFYERKHIFTHIEWHMRVCSVDVATNKLPEGWVFLDETHALPTAYKICL
jgi:A/G-specific adenine glycosylase